jgi:hypothetical protein
VTPTELRMHVDEGEPVEIRRSEIGTGKAFAEIGGETCLVLWGDEDALRGVAQAILDGLGADQ